MLGVGWLLPAIRQHRCSHGIHAALFKRNIISPIECAGLQAAHAELGKTAQDFRRLHQERQELLGQWEGVLKAISKRDAAILEAGELWLDNALTKGEGNTCAGAWVMV